MNRSKIIEHYKSFFGLEDMGLAENDQLMIDWAEALLKSIDSKVDSEQPVKLNSAYNPNCAFCHGTGMQFMPFFGGGGISQPCFCNLKVPTKLQQPNPNPEFDSFGYDSDGH